MASRSEHIGKRELLSRIWNARDTVASLIAAIPPPALLQSGAIDRWSVRDLLAHFVAHEQRALAEIAAGRRGERLQDDPAGIDEFNARAVSAWASLGPAEALAAWDRSYRRVVELIEELEETDFAPGSARSMPWAIPWTERWRTTRTLTTPSICPRWRLLSRGAGSRRAQLIGPGSGRRWCSRSLARRRREAGLGERGRPDRRLPMSKG